MTSRPWYSIALACLAACAAQTPGPSVQAYVRALEAGQLDAAYSLTTPAYRAQVSIEQFRTRFTEAAARTAHAAAVQDAQAQLSFAAPELFGPEAAPPPGATVRAFAAAVRAGNFEEAWRRLSAPLRMRYSVEALAEDFSRAPDAAARLERAVVAAEDRPVPAGTAVRFPLKGGGAVVVIEEGDGWKLQALK
jgi:hypothetical protein